MRAIPLLILMLVCANTFAQENEVDQIIQSGNDYYKQQQYDKAAAEYAKALARDPSNITARFNHANALYKAGQQVDATKSFTELSAAVTDKNLRSKAYYNKGVILSAQKNLEESIEAYKNALRQNHTDKEARENLQKALLELKKKNPPQNEKDKDKNKDQQQNKSQSKMSPKEAEQRLNLLSQKEKEVQERLQKEKSKTGGGGGRDW